MDRDIKRFAFGLIILGLIIIILAIVEMILIFANIIHPVQLFSFTNKDFAIDGTVLFPQLPKSVTSGMKVTFFPSELINRVLNYGLNTMLMTFIIFAGSKISGIGVQLLRPLKNNE